MGHVLKENFDPEDRDMYRRELKENTFLKEKVELEKKMKEENAKAFDEWVEQKEMREQAIKCLNLIPKPESTSAEESKHHSIYSQTTTKRYDPEAVRESIDIGKALKKVDRTLYAEWAKWADKVFSANITMVMWDSFPPTACDVHSSAYSQVNCLYAATYHWLIILCWNIRYAMPFLSS